MTLPGTRDFVSFRDVFEVDGEPVRDRDERLARLFLDPRSVPTSERVQEIREESARYTLNAGVAIEDPLLVLSFMQQDFRERFAWTLGERDQDLGPDVWSVGFVEIASPTLVQRGPDSDVPFTGAAWIDTRTGRVLKTELRLDFGDETSGRQPPAKAEAFATFVFDEELETTVPVELRENYVGPAGEISSVATYGRFRRFGVTTEQVIDVPPEAPR